MADVEERYRVIHARGRSTGWEIQDRENPLERMALTGWVHPTKGEAQSVIDALTEEPSDA